MTSWARLAAGTVRSAWRASAAGSVALQQGVDRLAVRRGVVGPGDRPPEGLTGFYDYRGTATARELSRTDANGVFGLGRLVAPRSGRRGRPVALTPAAASAHTLVVGPSQSGKTTSIIVPWTAAALRAGYATVVADVKGDLVEQIGAELVAFGISGIRAARVDYRQPRPTGWAFVRELVDDRRLAMAAQALIGRERPNDPQPFFWQRDIRLLCGVLGAAHASGRPVPACELLAAAHDQASLEAYMSAYGTPRGRMLVHDALIADPYDFPRVMSGVINALEPLAVPDVDAILGHDVVRLEDALSGPGLLAFGAPMGDGRLGQSFAALLVNLLIERVHSRHGRPAHPVMLVVDEAARLVDRVDFEELLSTAAAARVSVVLAVQDISQLPEGRVRDGVLANCQTIVALPGTGATTGRALSDRLGRRPEVEVGTSHDRGHVLSRATTRRHAVVPVLDTREICDLPFGGRPALVHSRPLAVKPFVVDLDRELR